MCIRDRLKEVHLYKTGCLFTAPLVMGAILAGQDAAISQWRRIGALMGLAFQIQDDIRDGTKSCLLYTSFLLTVINSGVNLDFFY